MPKRRFMQMYRHEADYWMAVYNRWAGRANAVEGSIIRGGRVYREWAERYMAGGNPPEWGRFNWCRQTRPRNMLAFYCSTRGMGVMCFRRVKPAWLPPHGRRALVKPSELQWAGWVRKRPVKLHDEQVLYV
jgi:hypothetical protein